MNVCGHCERVVCPDCLGAHWQQDCDCQQLGPTTQALMGLGPLLQQLRAEERAFWAARGLDDFVAVAQQSELEVLELVQDAPGEHCWLTPETPWCRYHVILAATLWASRQGRAPHAG